MYTFSVYLFSIFVRIAALLGHTKAKRLCEGQRELWLQLKARLKNDEQRIWIHCASVGEFEQGRPLLDDIREKHPQYKILVTFFSPSGYELRKNFAGADYVFYLPYDTRRNANRFVSLVSPEIVFFIKYEFWRNFLKTIKRQQIPLYLVSAIFRPQQAFFKWYGCWYRNLLTAFTHFFVQNDASRELLLKAGYTNVTVVGDTRFDRVCRIFDRAQKNPEIEKFVNGLQCVVAGSTWAPDEELLARYINTEKRNIKWIIAPHELHENHIERLKASIKTKTVRYSQLKETNPADCQVLIIDNIGMLSSLYRHGVAAYIGGGFGKGIHNTLEAAVYSIPVLFGPAHKKFKEATDLVTAGGAIVIKKYDDFCMNLNDLLDNPDKAKKIGYIAGSFVASGRGATEKILRQSFELQQPRNS